MTAATTGVLPAPLAIRVFAAFASGYFMSYALRSVNAVIAPDLIAEFGLTNAQLGSLSSVYFFAFAAMQMPLGIWLDRFGSRRVDPHPRLRRLRPPGAVEHGHLHAGLRDLATVDVAHHRRAHRRGRLLPRRRIVVGQRHRAHREALLVDARPVHRHRDRQAFEIDRTRHRRRPCG